MRRAAILIFTVMLVLRAAASTEAFHGITPAFLQIPAVGLAPGTIHNLRWGGLRYVLFDSDADLLGNGSSGRQIFLFDLKERDVSGVLAIEQLSTSALDDNQRPRSGRRAVTVVYDAQPGGSGPRQLMLVDRHTGIRSQLTAGVSDSTNASVDDSERIIVFESSADFFATGVAGTQIYRIDLRHTDLTCPFPCASTGNLGLTQITNKVGTSHSAVVSNGGKAIAFESDADLLNIGQTQNQVYLYEGKSGTLALLSLGGPSASRNPTITRDSSRVVFESDANLTGSSTGGTQLFLHRRNKGTLEQLTDAPGGACTRPSISSNGHAVAFLSSDNLLGLGSTGPELYSYDLRKSVLSQLTDAPAAVAEPAYSSGVFTVFLADGDLAGNGSPGTQLYLINLHALEDQQVP